MKALVDNDILFKGACYGLLTDLISSVCALSDGVGILGVAWFVISKKILRRAPSTSSDFAIEHFKQFLEHAVVIEPSQDEQRMAAEVELAAQRLGLSLDAGESQLCAVLLSRMVPFLLTGDKRAIKSFEHLLDSDGRLAAMAGKIKCLEQLVLEFVAKGASVDGLKRTICAEAQVDKALTICFSCSSPDTSGSDCVDGLRSYIEDLRKHAARMLAA